MARARRSATIVPADSVLVERTYHRGIVRDSDIPEGGLYDAVDFLVEQPGLLYKRGGWERHSAAAGTTPIHWVGTIDVPQRVVAIAHNNHMYDVTSENTALATDLGSVGFYPTENSPTDVDRIILCDGTATVAPKYVRYSPGPDALVLSNLEGSPPIASRSTVHSSGIVLGAGTNDYVDDFLNRLWFEPGTADIDRVGSKVWDTTQYKDVTYPITGLASVQGYLLVFSNRHVERISGDTPPSVSNGPGNMHLSPFANVGCVDARSIVFADENIIFAGEEGVWLTNGSGLRSLTEKEDGTGIQSYWRSLFPRFEYANHTSRQLVGGMINRDFYIICIMDQATPPNGIVTLMCHLPTQSWTKVSNFMMNSMAQGTDEEAVSELYVGEALTNYVSRASRIVYPSSTNMSDGNGTAIQPTYTTRDISTGPGLKSYGFGWLSYKLTDGDASNPTLSVQAYTGLERWATNTAETMDDTGDASSLFVNRRRFDVNKDTQALWMKVSQTGHSAETEIHFLEVEERLYPAAADSLGR